jgi:hypothetical protein
MGVPMHYHAPHSIELVLDSPLPNGLIYIFSLPKNESLAYVQHSSIGHVPFQVCMGFQPLAPIDIDIIATYSSKESSHT